MLLWITDALSICYCCICCYFVVGVPWSDNTAAHLLRNATSDIKHIYIYLTDSQIPQHITFYVKRTSTIVFTSLTIYSFEGFSFVFIFG